MIQKILIAGLIVGIIAVIGFGLIDAAQVTPDSDSVILATESLATDMPEITAQPTAEVTEILAETTPDPQPVIQAQDSMGEAWLAEGTVTLLEDFGFTLATADGEYYVELGPPTYWQAQGVNLADGAQAIVDGYYNGEQVHARVVTVEGAELVIRTEAGQPMWAGGADHETNGEQQAAGGSQFQVAAEDWVTLSGVIGSASNGNVTLNVDDGSILNLQMGQPQFWQSQGIALSIGDPVEVLGFWSGDQFMAGDIRK
ncbi:MAG: hypothetical protein KC496_22440, partial [Anaerolineae bacterium]|nr:hypothetical protein [Anaerolineae bacterium]